MVRSENQSTVAGGNRALWGIIGFLATMLVAVGAFVGRQAYANSIAIAASEERVVNVAERVRDLGCNMDKQFAQVRSELKEQTGLINSIIRSIPEKK